MIKDTLANEVRSYLQSKYPDEGCGFILKNHTFVPCENIAHDKHGTFEIDVMDYMKNEGDILAIVHSHPDGKSQPSKTDMESQIATAVPFGLCVTRETWTGPLWFFGDGIPDVDLIGRSFRHGPTGTDGKGDCFALIRDYYRTLGVNLKDYPRDDEWWTNGENMYEDYFQDAGFIEVQPSDIKVHDVFMMSINSKSSNHAGIWIGNNLILHHLARRLSRREPVGGWNKFVVKWVRYRDFM